MNKRWREGLDPVERQLYDMMARRGWKRPEGSDLEAIGGRAAFDALHGYICDYKAALLAQEYGWVKA